MTVWATVGTFRRRRLRHRVVVLLDEVLLRRAEEALLGVDVICAGSEQ